MNILLLSPNEYSEKSKWHKRLFYYSRLSLAVLRNLTPNSHTVQILDENVENIDYDSDVDLVGITVHTSVSPKAYKISEEFKRRGRAVVMGGHHPTSRPDESLKFANAVVIGNAEHVWKKLLLDFEKGELQRKYHSPWKPSLETLAQGKRVNQKAIFPINSLMTSIGCSQRCTYCATADFYQGFLQRDLDSVINEITEMDSSFINIMDSNIVGNKKFAKKLFKKMIPLGLKWVSQAPISIAYDEELLDLMAESGCIGLGVGLETISQDNVNSVNKKSNKVEDYQKNIAKIHSKGIALKGYFIFGFDYDTTESFERTAEFAIQSKIDLASFNTLTPYPGTRLYKQFQKEGRLIHTESDYPGAWALYDRKHCVFAPKLISQQELEYGLNWIYGEFYSSKSVKERLSDMSQYSGLQKTICMIYNGLNILSKRSRRKNYPLPPSQIFLQRR